MIGLCIVEFIRITQAPLCAFRALTGIPCPGCGLSRASLALFELHFVEAYHYHPLVFVILPAGIFFSVWAFLKWLLPQHIRPMPDVPTWAVFVILAVVLSVWISRFFGGFGGFMDPVGTKHGFIMRSLSKP